MRPAMYVGSTAFCTTSSTRLCSPSGPVEPTYMAGRMRIASSPRSTVMLLAL